MENYSENLKGQLVRSEKSIISKKFSGKSKITKKFHQQFTPFTHTHTRENKITREGQIPRSFKHLSVENFLWRYNNKEKVAWIR